MLTLSCEPVSVSNIGAYIKMEKYKVSFNRKKKYTYNTGGDF